ncbi:hypothetical protein ACPA1H_24695, partial [Ectopseudomonas chengduensis]
TDAITISKPRNRDGSTGHVLAKRSVTFTEIRNPGHVAAIHPVCRNMALRHEHRAASGSLSAQYGAESSLNRHRAGQLWH